MKVPFQTPYFQRQIGVNLPSDCQIETSAMAGHRLLAIGNQDLLSCWAWLRTAVATNGDVPLANESIRFGFPKKWFGLRSRALGLLLAYSQG
jgi:hypothetical protein